MAGVRERWQCPVVGAFIVWAAVRVVLYSVAIVTHVRGDVTFFRNPVWFAQLFWDWDAHHLSDVAENGYVLTGPASTEQAFFPGFPLATRGVATVLFGGHPDLAAIVVAGVVVTMVASLIAAIVFWRILADRFDDRIALAGTVLLMAGPYSHFLVASYSEALFLAFGLGAWLCASRGRWLAAGILGALASATRINGLFLVVALVVLFVLVERREARPVIARAIGLGAIGVSGAVAYFLYLFARTGNVFAWTTAQEKGWHRVTQAPWETFRVSLDVVIDPASATAFRIQGAFDILFAALVVVGVVFLVRRRWWAETVYVVLTAVPLMTSLSYLSLARNTLLLFPLVMLVASTLRTPRYRWIYWATLAAGVAILLFNARQFALGLWSD